jgi:hypothetical protein
LRHNGYGLHHWIRGRGQRGAKEEEDDMEDPIKIFPTLVLLSSRHFTARILVSEQGWPTETLAHRSGPRGPKGGPPMIGSIASPPPHRRCKKTTTNPPHHQHSEALSGGGSCTTLLISPPLTDPVAYRVLGTHRPGLESRMGWGWGRWWRGVKRSDVDEMCR